MCIGQEVSEVTKAARKAAHQAFQQAVSQVNEDEPLDTIATAVVEAEDERMGRKHVIRDCYTCSTKWSPDWRFADCCYECDRCSTVTNPWPLWS